MTVGHLKTTGRFERFGKPRNFMWLDPLPVRLFFRDGDFDATERRMFRRYFVSWLGAWVIFALSIYASIVTQV